MKAEIILRDFEDALKQFQDALTVPATSDLLRAGCIQYFEFCFELAWKSVKVVAEDQGLNQCNSPKSALKSAFANSWIDEEEVWLEMLSARNRMAHTYNAREAMKIYDSLKRFCEALGHLLTTLKQEVQ